MNRINSINDIPEFTKAYIIIKESYKWIETSAHIFCKYLLDTDYDKETKNNVNIYTLKIEEDNYEVKKFLNFYFEKIRIDKKGFCPYEEELDLPESVSNEVFKMRIEDEEKIIFIDSLENNILTLIEIK
nr:MAG TPA: hypothetical protein [Herelleviridae sp.]